MNDIQYVGEHLVPGFLGNLFIVISFVTALASAISYYFQTKSQPGDTFWTLLGRRLFYAHTISIIGIVATLFYILFNHLYEYKYAFDHLNNEMPMKYVFSCMWEGQEGSFLLWTFWHVILGVILIRNAKDWEPWVMAVVAMVQVFLSSMLIGVYFGEFQFGSNPFLLNRESVANFGLPWTENANYLELDMFTNGKGLNPLLQNYWMTIHPPTLFLGFASTLIPFAFAIAGLWRGDRNGWMRPAIPWAFFGVMILGTGILMGGAWAYEALGFGGFWAWDPVENASLVPWLTFVAAAHLLVINYRKGTSTFTTLILTASTFILVLYSTFLTRSGVLGDSSVHSFVDSGILAQLLVYLLFFVAMATYLMTDDKKLRTGYLAVCAILFLLGIGNLLTMKEPVLEEGQTLLPGEGTWIPMLTIIFILTSVVYLILAYKKHYTTKKQEEEALWSREFWMFIGALVLTLSAIHITVVTSVNVGNIFLVPFENAFQSLYTSTNWEWAKDLAGHNFSAPGDKERFDVFHKIQVPLAAVLFLIVSIGQFLKYKDTPFKTFAKNISITFGAALIIAVLLFIFTPLGEEYLALKLLMFALIFAVLANMDYAIRFLKGKWDHIGASVAHVGFAMLIIGAVISTSQSYFISKNVVGNVSDLSEEFSNNQDMMILKGDTMVMGDYFVHYKNKVKEDQRIRVEVEYFDKLPKTYAQGDLVEMEQMVFQCTQAHTATDNFLKDWSEDSLWTVLPMAEDEDFEMARMWQPSKPGDYLFTLEPTVLMSPKGNSREPSTKHFLGKDIYTFIKYTELEEPKTDKDGYLEPRTGFIREGEPVRLTETITMNMEPLAQVDSIPVELPAGVVVKKAKATITDGHDTEEVVLVAVTAPNGASMTFPTESKQFQILLALAEKSEGLELTAQQHVSTKRDMLIMTAQIFPQINVLWLGCIVMVIGTVMAIRHRIRLSKK